MKKKNNLWQGWDTVGQLAVSSGNGFWGSFVFLCDIVPPQAAHFSLWSRPSLLSPASLGLPSLSSLTTAPGQILFHIYCVKNTAKLQFLSKLDTEPVPGLTKQDKKRKTPQENVTLPFMSDRQIKKIKNTCLQNWSSKPPAVALHLTDAFGKIGHTQQKCVCNSQWEKPWAIGESFLKYSQLFLRCGFSLSPGSSVQSLWRRNAVFVYDCSQVRIIGDLYLTPVLTSPVLLFYTILKEILWRFTNQLLWFIAPLFPSISTWFVTP